VLPLTKAGLSVTVSDLTVANSDNGAIANFMGGTLTLANCAILNNSSQPGLFGGGVGNGGTMTISGCTFSGNSATEGGGISNVGTMTITGSTLSGNTALLPFTGLSPSGGGIFNQEGTLTIIGSMLSGNSSQYGGGIANGVLGCPWDAYGQRMHPHR
jgi:hypothetical protein